MKKKEKNMMSSTSADVNENVNPVYADVIQVKAFELLTEVDNPEMFKDWRNLSLQDIIRILKDMAKPGEAHGLAAVVMGNIVLRKLLEQLRIRMFLSRWLKPYILLLRHRYTRGRMMF